MNTAWNKEVDVIVVGYGLAGGVAAIEAHDAGAKVLILEKGEYPGGISIISGGAIDCTHDVEATIKYLTHTQGDRVAPNLIRHFAQGMAGNEEYVRSLARVNGARVESMIPKRKEAEAPPDKDHDYTATEYPFGGGYAFHGIYPFPGRESIYSTTVAHIPGFNGDFPWVQRHTANAVNLMKVVFDNVETRNIDVMLSTPGKRLVADADGTIIGVIARGTEKGIAIRAHRAVILACGGFEQNPQLLEQYMQGKPTISCCPLTHTGDGLIMAQKVGAALWHMWLIAGSYGFKFPEFPIGFRHPFGGPRNPKRIMPWIVVDRFGNRYMNEFQPAPQDTMHRPMESFDPDIPGYPRIPSYIVFDDLGMRRGPIARPIAVGERIYNWSKDNTKEVERGWILREGSIRELAIKIKETSDNEGWMEPEALEATVIRWNENFKAGTDQFRRPPGTMMPIEAPPFCAIPVWPMITSTWGGPKRNENQQVLDPFEQPISHLYCAGELGGFWAHLFLLGGALAECLISGRIAGRNAAKEPTKP